MRCAVVGHIEWVEFARVPAMPQPGDIVHATSTWSEPAGGGAVIASQINRLAGGCDFFTALGDDEIGRECERGLTELGLTLHVQYPDGSDVPPRVDARQRAGRAHDHLAHRRSFFPGAPLPLGDFDAVFFVSGDVEALRSARRAPFVAATTREQPTLLEGGVPIDLLVGSLNDAGERFEGGLDVRTVVLTDGARGGVANGEHYDAVEPPGPIVDTYGAGDSFSAALCFGLARGDSLPDALHLAASAGAAVITGRGPYTSQLTLAG